jgi:hypothetical protein
LNPQAARLTPILAYHTGTLLAVADPYFRLAF